MSCQHVFVYDLEAILTSSAQEIAIRNLDYILTVSSHAFASAAPEILGDLEKLLDLRSSEPWSYRRLPTPTATFPVIINSEEEDSESEFSRSRDNHKIKSTSKIERDHRSESFLQPKDDLYQGICKQVRALRKKLQQIEMLESKQSNGHHLDDQQIAKLQTRLALEISLADLGVPVETLQAKAPSSVSPDGRGNKRAEASRKQKRRSKKNAAPVETVSSYSGTDLEPKPVKEFLDVVISDVSKNKVRFLNFLYLFMYQDIME